MSRPPPSPPLQDRLLGTLVVIVLRAKNLPNRVRIGKQNPYATVTYGLHKKRTETIERGGQQPTWDAEFRFEILKEEFENEQLEAGGAAHVDRKGGVLPMSSKDAAAGVNRLEKPKPTVTVGDGRILKLACWADDNRDPRLIGEGELNIDDTIRKGKFDDWVKLERKDRYAGEVYLELTWYSNGPKPANLARPERSESPSRSGYGGAGARLNDDDDEDNSEERDHDGRKGAQSRNVSHRQSQTSLEPSSAPLDLAPDYPDSDLAPLSANHYPDSDLDPLTRSMSALSVARPLPQPPVSSHSGPYPAAVAHSQTYSHFPTTSEGYDYPRERRTSFQSAGPSAGYPYHPEQQLPQQHAHQYPGYPEYAGQPSHPSEFGTYPDPGQGHLARLEPHQDYQPQPRLGEFEQLAHEHYASQVYDQSSVSSQRPLPQPGAPSTQHSYDPYGNGYGQPPLPASSNPYPPPLPPPPVPPIPPSTSVYWQKQQLQQQQQYQQSAPAPLPPSTTYSHLPPSVSHQQLPHSASYATIHPSPSTPSFAPPPAFSAPPPSHLSQSYSNPPHSAPYAPSFAPPPIFSPPPPPPSLQGNYTTPAAPPGPYPSPYPPQQQQHTLYNPSHDASAGGRPPLPPPPPSMQHYRLY
ncbi:hypothetical protein JCM11491_001815 [Sporobolomyces phaffii]